MRGPALASGPFFFRCFSFGRAFSLKQGSKLAHPSAQSASHWGCWAFCLSWVGHMHYHGAKLLVWRRRASFRARVMLTSGAVSLVAHTNQLAIREVACSDRLVTS